VTSKVPLIISYYTIDTPYEELAERLGKNLESFNLEYDFRGLPDQKNWCRNCALKGPFVRDMMKELNQPLVWLDLDAEVMKYPKLFTELDEYDMAVFIHQRRRGNIELVSNVALFNPTPKCRETLELWAGYCEADPNTWDQRLLHRAVQTCKPHAFMLPVTYSTRYAPAKPAKWESDETVIRQYQVSRAVKGRKRAHPEMEEIFKKESENAKAARRRKEAKRKGR
jgi:hypothetical protein